MAVVSPILDQYGQPIVHAANAYKGAEYRPQWKEWLPAHRAGNAAIGESWDLMTSRVRDLFRNTPEVRSICNSIAKHVVGAGINTFADVVDDDGYDERFNVRSDDLWERWWKEEADVTRRMSWGLMQWLHFKEIMTTGTSILLECLDETRGRSIPLCYQHIESEQIDRTVDRPATKSSNRIDRGIEYDDRNNAVAYWIFDEHPHDYMSVSSHSTRYPASRVIHSYLPNRPSELSGVTWFAANIQTAKDLDWYLGNELTAAALGAALALVVKRKNGVGTGLGPRGTDDDGNPVVRLGRPFIADIGAEDEVTIAESKRPNRDADPFVKLMLMLHGMAIGVSKLRVSGDYSESSYTSARGAHLDDQAFFLVLQEFAECSFVRRVRKRHTEMTLAYGRIPGYSARDWLRDTWHYARVTVQPPGREQLDPEMETDAALTRIAGGLSTLQDECGARGLNWRRNIIQRAREIAFCKQKGVELTLSKASQPSPRGDRNNPAPAAGKPRPAPASVPN